jgi:hypothetical protein
MFWPNLAGALAVATEVLSSVTKLSETTGIHWDKVAFGAITICAGWAFAWLHKTRAKLDKLEATPKPAMYRISLSSLPH